MLIEALSALTKSERHNEQLAHRLNQLLKRTYGSSSERMNPAQLALAFAELEKLKGDDGESPPEPKRRKRLRVPGKKKGHGRKA